MRRRPLMNLTNLILNTDSYKFSHYLQYPPETQAISSYVEARGHSDHAEVLFFGLQMFLKDYLSKPVMLSDIDEAEAIVTAHGLPFNREGWEHIVHKHGGYLPLLIEALPEGTLVRRGVPVAQVVNTDPACFWLTSYIETALLRAIWYPSTVASNSRKVKQIIQPILERTCDDPAAVLPFRLHDFGARGTTSFEQAGIGGVAHLVNFMGTDTVTGVLYARRYYGADMAGFSIPASEHSTMTSWGQDREAEAYGNMIDRFGAKGLYAVVSDSYDINNAVSEIWASSSRTACRPPAARSSCAPTAAIRWRRRCRWCASSPMPSARISTPRATKCSTTACASSRATASRPPISASSSAGWRPSASRRRTSPSAWGRGCSSASTATPIPSP